jgi:Sensors of blue-light using FAD
LHLVYAKFAKKPLLYIVNNSFLVIQQTLINTLYDKIKTDPRHDQARLIAMGPIQEKSFPSWHMGARKMLGNEVDFKTDISAEDKEIFNGLLNGREENGAKVLSLLKKFF